MPATLADIPSSFTASPVYPPFRHPAFLQSEHPAYARLSRDTEAALVDVREDVDDAFVRAATNMVADPDAASIGPLGVYKAGTVISNGDADDLIVLSGKFDAEAGGASPVKGAVTIGEANDQIVYEARVPGNGTRRIPRGNRIIVVHDDNDLADQALSVDSAVLEVNGENYLVIVVRLEVSTATIQTTVAEIMALSDPTDATYDADLGVYLLADDGVGNGTGTAVAGAWQLAGAEGGLYGAYYLGAECQVTDWDIDNEAVTVWIDGSAHAVGSTVKIATVANGFWSAIDVAVAA